MAMKRHRFRPIPPFKLQLTSLMDMFTIILVFLLMSFSSEDYDFVLQEGLRLPQSSSQATFRPAVNVIIAKDFIRVEENVVARLQNGEVSDAQIEAGRIEPVMRAVKRARELRQTRRQNQEEIVVIQADRQLPYRTIYLVMRSCSLAGYTRYRLAIEKD